MAPIEISNLKSISIQWLAIVIAVYYGIHMIFMSTLSADLTADEPPKWIDSLKDLLYDPFFNDFIPMIFTHEHGECTRKIKIRNRSLICIKRSSGIIPS